ncbi:MAG: folate-binding protein YgfZ [Sphingomonas sp.]|nr:folate-binding protein YgfZ [Sphingomonas sp.]
MAATTLTDRAVVRVSGEDVRGFLQGLVTNNVNGPLPVWAGLLTPQGKCLFDFIIWADGEDLLLDCEAAAADDLIKRLTIYRLRRPIRIERDPSLAVHWSNEGGEGLDDPRLPELGRRWIGPPDEPASGWLKHRLLLGVTEGLAELGDILWLECSAVELPGVSFTKGCFVGHENTARMNWRQKVNRRLVVVDGTEADRAVAEYPAIGLSVVHARVDGIPPNAILPDWLKNAI